MRYEFAPDLQELADEVSKILFPHVDIERVKCFRSFGTSSRGTIARCHALGKLMQKAIGIKAHYALEFLSERFDKMNAEDQVKVVIHELMHIPQTFGGGFRHHDHVTTKNVNLMYQTYREKKEGKKKYGSWFGV
ncbi:metallopeptidase [Candidatus Pacearchaeota archaeon]|nr:metallopeptidase [Candidatus Pacearchaeota archaeon]